MENVPFKMMTYNDTDGSKEHNTVVLIILLPNQIAEDVQGKTKFTWKIEKITKISAYLLIGRR